MIDKEYGEKLLNTTEQENVIISVTFPEVNLNNIFQLFLFILKIEKYPNCSLDY